MENVCPLCGRKRDLSWDSFTPDDPMEIENQIENLDRVLDGLKAEDESLLQLIEDRVEMCPMCQELMHGIDSESQRKELEVRINQQVEKLEEQVEDKIVGQL